VKKILILFLFLPGFLSAAVTTFQDTFTDIMSTDGLSAGTHVPDIGSTWTVEQGTWGITNTAYLSGSWQGCSCLCTYPYSETADDRILNSSNTFHNGSLFFTIVGAANFNQGAVMFNIVDASHRWQLVQISNTWYLQYKNGGAWTTAATQTVTVTDGMVIEIRVSGDDMTFFHDGTEFASLATNSSIANTGTTVGMRLNSTSSMRLDDFYFDADITLTFTSTETATETPTINTFTATATETPAMNTSTATETATETETETVTVTVTATIPWNLLVSGQPTPGTVFIGAVEDTRQLDTNYWVIREVGGAPPGFGIYGTFQNVTTSALSLNLTGFYDGNAGHVIVVQMYDYVLADYVTVSTSADTIKDALSDQNYWWNIDNPDYLSGGGEMIMRLLHTSAGNVNHYMNINYVSLDDAKTRTFTPTYTATETATETATSTISPTATTTATVTQTFTPGPGSTLSTRNMDSGVAVILAGTSSITVPLNNIFQSYRVVITPYEPISLTTKKFLIEKSRASFIINMRDSANNLTTSIGDTYIMWVVFRNSGE
jgi:hypothetical protein